MCATSDLAKQPQRDGRGAVDALLISLSNLYQRVATQVAVALS